MKRRKRGRAWKEEEISAIKKLTSSYRTVGIAKVKGIGAKQLQKMRKEFLEKVRLKVSKNSLIGMSLRGKEMEGMIPFIEDPMALIFTDLDAFSLYNIIEEGKKPTTLKAGSIAPMDIIIESGRTSLRPGPIVGELQSLGIVAGIESGEVVIKKGGVVVKEGEKVLPKVAEILAKLEIYPIKKGLNLCAVYEDGVILTPEVLHIDHSKYFSEVMKAAENALSLAVNVAYPTHSTIKSLLHIAYSHARNLSINACIYEKDTISYFLLKAHSRAQGLAQCLKKQKEEV